MTAKKAEYSGAEPVAGGVDMAAGEETSPPTVTEGDNQKGRTVEKPEGGRGAAGDEE